MGIGRACAGQLVGWAYDRWGACALWATVWGFWAFQFLPLLYNWKAWHPLAIEERNRRIRLDEELRIPLTS